MDPDSLNLDPDLDPDLDPAFQVNPDPLRIQGFDGQKLKKKKIQQKIFVSFFDQKLQFTNFTYT